MPVDVVGSVDDANLLLWQVKIGRVADTDDEMRVIADGQTPVSNGVLGTFDPTLLQNGQWRVVLEAEDVNGAITRDEIVVRVDGQAKVGVFSLSFVDMQVPLAGIPISVVRTYDSRVKTQEDFGVGWSLSVKQGSVEHNVEVGDFWQIATSTQPFQFACQIVVEQQDHLTEVRLSDREVYLFRPKLVNAFPFSGGCRADVVFEQVGGTRPGATLDILGLTGVRASGALVSGENDIDLPDSHLTDELTGLAFRPKDFRLTTARGAEFDLTAGKGIRRIADPNGNEIQFLTGGIVHSSGASIAFERDAEGRIERLIDPLAHTVAYAYDGAGDLIAVTNQVGDTTGFEYAPDIPHHLETIIDPLGHRAVAAEYDSDGRLISLANALDEGVAFDHDLAARQEIATDAAGNPTLYNYDERGNVTSMVDALGGTRSFTYDADDNVLTQTDEAGHTRSMEYDAASNLTRVEDPLSNVASFTYDAAGNLLTALDPRLAQTSHAYDAANNLTSTTDAATEAVSATYDAQGLMTSLTDREGGLSSFEYDAQGRLTRRIDAEGGVAEMTYDALGRLTHETVWRTDDTGTLVADVTEHVYDALGREVETIDAAGVSTYQEYDALGRRVAHVDAFGERTEYAYDTVGRLTRIDHADGSFETT